jgi:hypothetical protein
LIKVLNPNFLKFNAMKIISKYQSRKMNGISRLPVAIKLSIYKIAVLFLAGTLSATAAFGQRGTGHKTADSMLYLFAGPSTQFVQRQAFDQWSRTNFNITEPYRPDVYVDLGGLYNRFDLGIRANVGGAFQTMGAYAGGRFTGDRSPIGSWLELEMGDFFGRFYNITPPTYGPVQSGQQLSLHYDAFYLSLVSKNYFNFLSYTAKLGSLRIPVNAGFFAGVGWQPGARNWRYGYYDQDSVFRVQRIKPIPKLGKLQGTAGVFMGF